MILADIVSGKTSTADVSFLIAVIVFGLATLVSLMSKRVVTATDIPIATALAYLGLGFLALGFLVL